MRRNLKSHNRVYILSSKHILVVDHQLDYQPYIDFFRSTAGNQAEDWRQGCKHHLSALDLIIVPADGVMDGNTVGVVCPHKRISTNILRKVPRVIVSRIKLTCNINRPCHAIANKLTSKNRNL